MVRLGEVCEIVKDEPKKFEGFIKYFSTGSIKENSKSDDFEMVAFDNRPSRADLYPNSSDVGFAKMKNTKKVLIIDEYYKDSIFSTGFAFLRCSEKIMPKYLFNIVNSNCLQKEKDDLAVDGIMGGIRQSDILKIKIPLPPLEIQRRIVAELDGYQKIIEGASQILASYKPTIRIDPEWPVRELREIITEKPKNGYSGKPVDYPTQVRVLSLSATTSGRLDLSQFKYLDEKIDPKSPVRCRKGDILLQRGNTAELVGTAALFDADDDGYVYPDLMIRIRADETIVLSEYLVAVLQSPDSRTFIKNHASGSAGSMPKINQSIVEFIPIPLSPLAIQREIVAELEAERALVEANRKLVAVFEKKIQAKLAEIWGEESTNAD